MKKSENANEWLLYAESDFELASKGKVSKKIRYETLCFHAQQTAEKGIKAVFVFQKIPFPKTHNIELLIKLLKHEDIAVPQKIEKSKVLTTYATESRYPDDFSPIDKSEYKQTLAIASLVLKWAKTIVEKKSGKLL